MTLRNLGLCHFEQHSFETRGFKIRNFETEFKSNQASEETHGSR
jgi:hypothetical protein